MGIRIFEGREAGAEREGAVLFCSTTGIAFGPIFNDHDAAEDFLSWVRVHRPGIELRDCTPGIILRLRDEWSKAVVGGIFAVAK